MAADLAVIANIIINIVYNCGFQLCNSGLKYGNIFIVWLHDNIIMMHPWTLYVVFKLYSLDGSYDKGDFHVR